MPRTGFDWRRMSTGINPPLGFHRVNSGAMEYRWTQSETPVWTDEVASPIRHQHPLHAAGEAACGRETLFFALKHGGRLLGAAQVGLRNWPLWGRFAILGRGPIWAATLSEDRRRQAVEALLSQLRGTHRGVMAAPDPISGTDPISGRPWLPVVTGAQVAVLPLGGSLKDLRAKQSVKWRNRLSRAERSGLVVDQGPLLPDPTHWVFAREQEQRRTRRYRGAPIGYTLGWLAAGGKRSARLFTAWREGEIIASMLFLLHAPGASYHIGWCSAAGRAANAHPLLLWSAISWLNTRGFQELDLDVIDTETEPGLARFKLGAGARPVAIGTTRLSAPGTGLIGRLGRQAA